MALGAILGGASATGGGIGGSTLLQDGAVSRAEIADGEYWRLVTAGFLHAGFFHLLFNMLSLYILGGLLEPAVGKLRFGLIYFVSLLAGLVRRADARAHAPTVGASGAIFGLMAATAVVMRNRGMSVMESGLGIWIVLNLVITFSVPTSPSAATSAASSAAASLPWSCSSWGPGAGAGGGARARVRGPGCRGRGRRDRGVVERLAGAGRAGCFR